MYAVTYSSNSGDYVVDTFDSFETAEDFALDQFGLTPLGVVSIIELRTGRHVFIVQSAA